jgi:1,4-dihydroxy-2-naphthoyl-CoA hydrolase
MTDDHLERLRGISMPFAEYLGIVLTEATTEVVSAELEVRPELCNRNGIMHGGALMSLADNLGGLATGLNLAEGFYTTTIESKTNFISAIPAGQKALAECRAIHRGRTTMVWQTTIRREDGKTAAVVSQTQLVLAKKG